MKKSAGIKFLICGILASALVIIFIGCNVGLGSMINTDVPVISIPGGNEGTGRPGSFFAGSGAGGSNRIWLDVRQEFGLSSVMLYVEYNKKSEHLQPGEQNPVTDSFEAAFDSQTGLYYHDLDVSAMEDGAIKTWIVARDKSGNTTQTTDMIYTVKNKLPQIELTSPRLVGSDFDGDRIISIPRAMIQGSDITGIATDMGGIAQGYPQIMIWHDGIDDNLIDSDDAPAGWTKEFGQWHSMLNEKYKELPADGFKAVQFYWPLCNLQGSEGNFRPVTLAEAVEKDNKLPILNENGETITYFFKMRVKDVFGRENIYPYRADYDPAIVSENNDGKQNDRIAVNLLTMTNPIIKVFDPARFYNRAENFEADIHISSETQIIKIRAAVQQGTIFNFPDSDRDSRILARWSPVLPEGITGKGADEYKITIPSGLMPQLNGEWFLHIEAMDRDGKPGYFSVGFIIDDTLPELQYIQPVGLEHGLAQSRLPEVTSTVTFQGLVSDNNRVSKMYYVLGKTEVDNSTCALSDCTVAGSGHANCYWIDTRLDDTFNPQNRPQTHTAMGATIAARWNGNFSNWQWTFTNISDLIMNPSQADSLSGNYFVEHSGGVDSGTGMPENLWILPVSFKVVDDAGNIRIETVRVIINPEADRPKVEVDSHVNNPVLPAIVGGEVRISGTAEDNDWVHSVWIRVYKVDNNNNKTAYVPLKAGAAQDSWIETDYPSANKSSFISWNYTLNRMLPGQTSGPLDPPNGVDSHRVLVELYAKDALAYPPSAQLSAKQDGRIRPLYLTFSNKVPRIIKTQLIWGGGHADITTAPRVDYEIGARVSGFVTLVATVQDDEVVTGIKWNELSSQGGGFTNYEEVITNTSDRSRAFVRPLAATIYGNNRYELFIPLDTAGIRNGWYNNRAESYSLNIQVSDNNDPVQTSTALYTMQIDNYFPLANFTGYKNAAGSYRISGNAWDRQPGINVHGAEMVVVYFSRPTAGVNLNNEAAVAADFGTRINLSGGNIASEWINGQNVVVNRSSSGPGSMVTAGETGTSRTLPFFPNVQDSGGNYVTSNSGIVISTSRTEDGYSKGFEGDPDISWYVIYDSSRLADGYAYLNYVVFDRARNASHYKELIYIANNRPRLTSISLGTDIDGTGTVTGSYTSSPTPDGTRSEYRVYEVNRGNSENLTGFRVRNNRFVLRLNAQTVKGNQQFNNNSLRYRVSYVSGRTTGQTSIAKGGVYAIENPGTNAPWNNYGVFDTPEAGYVFVAKTTAVLTGGATVTRYTADSGANAFKTAQFANTQDTLGTAITFDAASFPANGSIIPDSGKESDGSIAEANRNKRYFIVKVFDGTVSGGGEEEQLSYAGIVAVDIDNTDQMLPRIEVAPFGMEYVLRPSLVDDTAHIENYDDKRQAAIAIADGEGFLVDAEYDKNIVTGTRSEAGTSVQERKGYVQYSVAAAAADVSGKVIFRGRAADNQRISRITVQITNSAGNTVLVPEFDIAARQATGDIGHANTIETLSADNTANRWGFRAGNQRISLAYGHVLDWEFGWDSSQIANQQGAVVTFRVYDHTTEAAYTRPVNASVYSSLNVNVVPYITEVVTQLSGAMTANPSEFNRSSTGWYPVREKEVITIKGFNFHTGSAAYSVPSATIGGIELGNRTAGTLGTAGLTYRQRTQVTGEVGVNLSSGALLVTAQTRPSINNLGNNDAAYNKEPNRANNNTLTNDRYMYVWNIGYLLNQSTAQYPIMRMNSSGTRHIIYADFLGSSGGGNNDYSQMHISVNNQVKPVEQNMPAGTLVERTVNRYINTGLAIDEANNWYAGVSNITSLGGSTNYFAFHARGVSGASGVYGFTNGGSNKRRILPLHLASTMDTNRVRFPRLAARTVSGGATRVFISYYDGHAGSDGKVVFHYGLVGDTISGSNQSLASSGVGGNLVEPNPLGSGGVGLASTNQQQVVATNSTTHKGSQYTAVGGLSDGRPVVAWYDRINQNLVFSFGSGVPTATAIDNAASIVTTQTGANTSPAAGTWQGNAVIIQRFAGSHVDMAVDQSNNVHLAYYDVFNGGLYYAFIPSNWYNMTSSARNAHIANNVVKVDTYLSAGTKLMINVRREGGNDIPYISYFHESFNETTHSIRVAWPKHTINSANPPQAGSDSLDRLTGAWEVMSVPAQTVPLKDYYICNGVPVSNTVWAGSLPTGSTLNHSSLSNSILVGYMTSNWYEGAILKVNP